MAARELVVPAEVQDQDHFDNEQALIAVLYPAGFVDRTDRSSVALGSAGIPSAAVV